MTPAVTLDSTASMNARRVSSCVFAVRSAFVCSSSRPGHPIEGRRQRLHFVFGLRDRHPGGKIAGLDAARGVDQLADRSHEPIRKPKRGQDRQADDDQRAEQEAPR